MQCSVVRGPKHARGKHGQEPIRETGLRHSPSYVSWPIASRICVSAPVHAGAFFILASEPVDHHASATSHQTLPVERSDLPPGWAVHLATEPRLPPRAIVAARTPKPLPARAREFED